LIEARPLCPECDEWLSLMTFKDEDTGEIIIEFFCEGAADDEFGFQIFTGMIDDDLEFMTEVGKRFERKMGVLLTHRSPDPYLEEDLNEDVKV